MFRVFKENVINQPDFEKRVEEIQSTDSPMQRDQLLRELEPHVARMASRVCQRVITKHDDEYMIAYSAMDEAIERFQTIEEGSFLAFAFVVIRGRLIDYYRHEKKHQNQIPLEVPGYADSESEMLHPELNHHSVEQYQAMGQAEQFRNDIAFFTSALEVHGITLEEVVKKCPKHRDTRESMFEIAKTIVSKPTYLQSFYQLAKLDKELMNELGFHRRTLTRHRVYLIALTIILSEDVPYMKSYLVNRNEEQ
ncbi:sigma-70 family RNA polymerase sigma factor [Baia soyae]|uniref:RNA polymerase sigma factor SigI n=1 Tax=Baia soyae TaxID=1544746 RepID=A0A4R2RFS1_9BACL|nr:sigma-70 family RNA polymerase sigma factor [Baia soyae]TCP62482.1 RNA polymerase sigma factor [Baia soyae]